MSAHEAQALSAIAFQLAATLDGYRQDMAAMVGAGFDPELYRRVSGHMDDMRMYAADLPPLSVAWVEVLISHFELTHGFWRVQKEGAASADLRLLHGHLDDAVQRLSRKCVLQMQMRAA
ncbi:MAG TPA: hypothetical protein VLK85_03760 [Ramlibacter sp.]|nr:hypothetical protein [Ramlibacter sp.]